jgi:hypothetical protein
MGRPMKVHGQLHGHRTRAELARRTLPVPDKPRETLFDVTVTFGSRVDADEFAAWLNQLWDDNRSECICGD